MQTVVLILFVEPTQYFLECAHVFGNIYLCIMYLHPTSCEQALTLILTLTTCHQILKSLYSSQDRLRCVTSMPTNHCTRDIPAQISFLPHMNPSLTNSRLCYQPLCTELRLGSLACHWRPAGLNEYICLLNGLADWMFKKSVCLCVCVEQM